MTYTREDYPLPVIRLADLYLLYAEALNEAQGPGSEALDYIDRVRTRAGLEGVAESWSAYSNNPPKYTNNEGLREIINRKRLIELAFEGHRLWELRHWQQAGEELNKPNTGASTNDQKRRVLGNGV